MTNMMAGAPGRNRLPPGVGLSDLVTTNVPPCGGATDGDPDTESEIFETRQAFLSLCQGNHYQFDTLRRAKHSSMMVLYHLHNPSAPAFQATCNRCNLEIEPGGGFRCPKCQDFDMCRSCKAQGFTHEHGLVVSTCFYLGGGGGDVMCICVCVWGGGVRGRGSRWLHAHTLVE
jgi:E1A/CREB-binding protein